MEKRWEVRNARDPGSKVASVSEVIRILLENRGLTAKKRVEEFLNPSHPANLTPAQVGMDASSLGAALSSVRRAMEKNIPIIIHGDFDVDGICATAILWEAIYRDLGYKNCRPFIPDRFEHGYGLTRASVDAIVSRMSESFPALLITVDCGITAWEAVHYAQSLGFQVLITDHHQKSVDNLPADAVLWTDRICGAGIAWSLARGIAKMYGRSERGLESGGGNGRSLKHGQDNLLGKVQDDKDSGLDLVALATIADIQPLLGPNRSFVKYGLRELNQTPRIGLKELVRMAGLTGRALGTYEVGWVISPRLNAAGRLDTAMDALRLLLTEDLNQAEKLAQRLNRLNKERQDETIRMTNVALDWIQEEEKVVVISHESFHEGVIGLLAGRLAERFHRPVVAISRGEEFSKGSARSISGFNIVKALREVENLLESVGGHPMAAGFTIRTERLGEFERRFRSVADGQIDKQMLRPVIRVDAEIPLSLASWSLWEELQKFEPFGCFNPRPLFLSRGVGVLDVAVVGSSGQHLRLKLQEVGESSLADLRKTVYSAIGFGLGDWAPRLRLGDRVDVVYSLVENIWNGNRSLELRLRDLRKV